MWAVPHQYFALLPLLAALTNRPPDYTLEGFGLTNFDNNYPPMIAQIIVTHTDEVEGLGAGPGVLLPSCTDKAAAQQHHQAVNWPRVHGTPQLTGSPNDFQKQ